MSQQVQVIPNAVLYCNNSTATNHKVTILSNGQFLVDGYFVISKHQLDTDFEIVPVMIGALGISDKEIEMCGQQLKAIVESSQHQSMTQGEPYKSFGTELRTHNPEEDKDARSRNIINVTTELTTARINMLPPEQKPFHIRVINAHLIPDGYHSVNLTIGGVEQMDIYRLYK